MRRDGNRHHRRDPAGFPCVDDHEENLTFARTMPPPDGAQWYTVRGKPHTNYAAYAGGVGGLASSD